MSKFKIGDRVRINCTKSKNHGRVTTITSSLELCDITNGWDGATYQAYAYDVDIAYRGGKGPCAYEEHELEPYYDGNELVAWSSCAWQPNQLRVC